MKNDLVNLAKQITRRAHQGQFRRDGMTPYIVHPEAVASRVLDDPDAQAIAWLHDVTEDTSKTRNRLVILPLVSTFNNRGFQDS